MRATLYFADTFFPLLLDDPASLLRLDEKGLRDLFDRQAREPVERLVGGVLGVEKVEIAKGRNWGVVKYSVEAEGGNVEARIFVYEDFLRPEDLVLEQDRLLYFPPGAQERSE